MEDCRIMMVIRELKGTAFSTAWSEFGGWGRDGRRKMKLRGRDTDTRSVPV